MTRRRTGTVDGTMVDISGVAPTRGELKDGRARRGRRGTRGRGGARSRVNNTETTRREGRTGAGPTLQGLPGAQNLGNRGKGMVYNRGEGAVSICSR